MAIPAHDEKVWKVSSEKIPHLTLLFLGENTEDVPKLERIVQFIEHAVENSDHGPCMLDIDERGTLGDDNADVLFFKKGHSIKSLERFRNQLLQQIDIRAAYDSVEQYPTWQPHLTLGYPDTPAHDDEIPEHGLSWITFDRISVWIDDYDGPEFKLRWPEGDLELAYSDAGKEAVEDLLHFGTKGMKWGVRNATKKTGRGLGTALTVAGDVQFENMAKDGRAHDNVEFRAHMASKRTDLPKINAKPEYASARKLRTRLRHPKEPLVNQYRQEVKTTYIKRLEEAANSQKNLSGTRQYTIRERGWELPAEGGKLPTSKHFWEVSTREIKHAGEDDATKKNLYVELTLDVDGFVTDISPIDPTAQHDVIALGEEFLEHFGTKGMKWGIRNRKGTPVAVTPQASSKVPHGDKRKTKIEVKGGENHPAHEDAVKVAEAKAKLKKSGPSALSNNELREVANRLQLENQVSVLTANKGKRFVTQQLTNEGQNLARAGVREGSRRGARKIGVAAGRAA